MNLSIIKKVIAIYRANNILFLLLFTVFSAASAQDFQSYCFGPSVNLHEVRQSLEILLLPKDSVNQRADENCLDITTSTNRGKLFEKYLSKRYDLKRGPRDETKSILTSDIDCRLDLKTTKNIKVESSNLKLGEKNSLKNDAPITKSTSVMEMLLGAGEPGELEAGDEKFKIVCQLIGTDRANLTFSYADKAQGSVSSQVILKKGEWFNIASVSKDLADKVRTIGVPQTEIGQSAGKSETVYELQFK